MGTCCPNEDSNEGHENSKFNVHHEHQEHRNHNEIEVQHSQHKDSLGSRVNLNIDLSHSHQEESYHHDQDKEFKITAKQFVQEKKHRIQDDYDFDEKKILGEGAYGHVAKGVHKKSQLVRAIKFIKKQPQLKIDELIKEVEILKEIDHPSVMKVFEYYQDRKYFYIISELCTGGELFDRIIQKKRFGEQEAAKVMKQLLSSLSYLHSHDIVHRDLKPENLLYKDRHSDEIKLIDFGLSQIMKINQVLTKKLGTPYYIAPEVLDQNYGKKCDIWSAGVMMYILLCGKPPFNGKNNKAIIRKVQKGAFTFRHQIWQSISSQAKELIEMMLTKNPKLRITAIDALHHDWFKIVNQQHVDQDDLQDALRNMKSFHSNTKMQQATYAYIASYLLTQQEEKHLRQVFQSLDENGDGELSREEIKHGYMKNEQKLLTENELQNMIDEVDINRSGTINYQEFLMGALNKTKIISNARLNDVFKMFDQDNNGYIEADDLQIMFGNQIDDDKLAQIIMEVDENEDNKVSLNKISFQEFKQMMFKIL